MRRLKRLKGTRPQTLKRDTKGQGLADFGAKWWLLSPSGTVIKTSATAPSSSSGMYGY
jgi:hypothetical protein